jgi:outer membrane cobalamin receptor
MAQAYLQCLLRLSAGMLCMAVAGVQANNVDLLSLSLEELMQTNITSSTLTEESLRTVPSSMTVFTRADIRRLGIQNLPQLVNLVPGYKGTRSDFSSQNQSISSRGRRLGTVGSEVLVLIDGQRLNNDWSGGASQDDALISLENVARVEFIRGPGSSIYGSNAVMGVINIITEGARELVLEAGADGRRHASAQWQWQGDVGRAALYAGKTKSTGQAVTIYEPFPNASTPDYVNTRDPFQSEDLYLQAELGDFSLNARVAQREMTQFYVSGYVDNENNLSSTDSQSINVGWHRTLASGVKLEGHVFGSLKAFDLRAAASLTPYLIVDGGVKEEELGTQWLLQGEYQQAHWLLGWEWRNPALVKTDATLGPPENPGQLNLSQAPEDGRYIQGIFGQYQTPLTENLALTLGLRRDSYSDFGAHISPRMGLVQQWGDKDTFKFLYSEAFRAPSRIETSVINSSGFEQNPKLAPETAKTAELVWLRLIAGGYVSGTLFNTNVEDAIVETVTPQLKRSWGNSQQTVGGMEFEWQNVWYEHWQSRLAVTRILNPVGFIHTESNTLLSGSLSYQNNPWTFSLIANYQGAKRDPNEQDVPANITTTEFTEYSGHSVYNAYVSYLLECQIELYLRVDNLFDKDYLLPAHRPANFVGVPGSGRSFRAGLRWSFK